MTENALSHGRFQAAGAAGVAAAGGVAPGGTLTAEPDGRRCHHVGARSGGCGLPPHGSRSDRWEASRSIGLDAAAADSAEIGAFWWLYWETMHFMY